MLRGMSAHRIKNRTDRQDERKNVLKVFLDYVADPATLLMYNLSSGPYKLNDLSNERPPRNDTA